ncbi:MAG: DUF4190 domain-containing protein [Coriobacteriia bacterium]|nr:DUF4190 domain-containing protein [Coriobacteriia bacterium]
MEQQAQQPNPQVPPPAPQPFNQAPMSQENPGKTLSIVGLVLGIIGLLITCSFAAFGMPLGLPFSIAALVCGIMGRNRTPQGMPSGMAVAGLVLGIVGIVVGIAALVWFFIIAAAVVASPEFMDLMEMY